MQSNPDIRWKQRFHNFDRAYRLLCKALKSGPEALNELEQEGTIQRFEFCFELAWKCLKDYLEATGFTFPTITPRQVLKDAYAAKLLDDGQIWIDMLDHRNLLSHSYDEVAFGAAVTAIHVVYLPALGQLHAFFQKELNQ